MNQGIYSNNHDALRDTDKVVRRRKPIPFISIVLVLVGAASSWPVLADPPVAQFNKPSALKLSDTAADKALIRNLLQDHLQRLIRVVQKSQRVQVVAYGKAEEKARILPICQQLHEELRAGVVQQPTALARMSDNEEAYYERVSTIAKTYAPAQEEKIAALQSSPKSAANARKDFKSDLDSWFLDRNWTYKGMYFPLMNSMRPDSKPRRYAHDLWLYVNGQAKDGQARYLQLEFLVYQEVGAKQANIDSMYTYDLTPDRGFGGPGSRLGFNGAWREDLGAQPYDDQYEAFGVAALGQKVITWNLFRKPKTIDIPPGWKHESWAYKTEIYSDLPLEESSGDLTCSLLIK
jgi:hypothetical protein